MHWGILITRGRKGIFMVDASKGFIKDGPKNRLRELRWRRGGKGKSGGVRVIYYFHSERMPLYLLTVFAKNERADLIQAERNDLASLVDTLVDAALGE